MVARLLIFAFFTSFQNFAFPQESNDYVKRLKAIKNETIIVYNIDGVDFSSRVVGAKFSEKDLRKLYREYSIKEKDIITDESLNFNNFFTSKKENIGENINQINSHYFVENKDKTVSVFWFGYFGELDKNFERKYINRILNDEIPESVFEQATIDIIDFAGRKIELGSSCYWTNINTVQCPYYGEMNWSVHKTLETARNSINNQFYVTKSKKGGKVISEEEIDVIFEGTETKAKKVVYDLKGIPSLLVGVSGGKTLIIYYVAAKVRGNYVSCCMSFWNNDVRTESGLSPLLEKVMQLKK